MAHYAFLDNNNIVTIIVHVFHKNNLKFVIFINLNINIKY